MSEQRKTVLLVDDDTDFLRGMSLRFQSAGYDTVSARSADQGLHAARQVRPQAILLDIRLDSGDGIEAMEQLKRDAATCDIPIVMLTACIADQQAALEKGARFFLRKPHPGHEVVKAVTYAIDNNPANALAPAP